MEFLKAGLYGIRWFALGFDVVPNICKSEVRLHADEIETFASMVIQPENVRFKEAVKEIPHFSLSERWIKPSLDDKIFFQSRNRFPEKLKGTAGVMGDPPVASKETGVRILEAAADDLSKIILEIVRFEKS